MYDINMSTYHYVLFPPTRYSDDNATKDSSATYRLVRICGLLNDVVQPGVHNPLPASLTL